MQRGSARVIVLRVIPHSESDLVLHALDTSGAKVVYYARGALRSRKRFGGGVLEPTHYIQVHFRKSRGEEGMAQLEEATLIEDFHRLRDNYDRLELGLYFVSLIDKMSREGDIHSERLFDLLGNALRAAEGSESLPSLKLQFELKLLAFHGVLPVVEGADALLKAPLREHASVALPPPTFRQVNSQVSALLHQHLH